MRQGDLGYVVGAMRDAHKQLREQWSAAQTEWNDPISQRFEESYLAPIEFHLLATVKSLDRLAQVLYKAELECRE